MEQSPQAPIELNPAALRSFADALESQVEDRLRSGVVDLEARFFPAGRGDQQRPFGRSPHHPGQRDLGARQQRNVAAHMDELARLRDTIIGLRHSVGELHSRFADAERAEEALSQRLDDTMNELRGPG